MTDRDTVSAKVCRGCGATQESRSAALAQGFVNCCPERSINDVIERDHGMPAMTDRVALEATRHD